MEWDLFNTQISVNFHGWPVAHGSLCDEWHKRCMYMVPKKGGFFIFFIYLTGDSSSSECYPINGRRGVGVGGGSGSILMLNRTMCALMIHVIN